MRVSDLYPMLSRLPILKYKVAQSIPLENVVAIPEARIYPDEVLKRFSPGMHVFYFKNVDVYVPDAGSWGELAVLYSKLSKGEGPWVVSVIDPNWVSQSINNTRTQAIISGMGADQPYDILYPDLFMALIGEGDISPFLWQNTDTKVVQESLEQNVASYIRMDEAVIPFTEETVTALAKSSVREAKRGSIDDLRDYLLERPGVGTGKDPQVPLLIGHTGASKSAIIKSMVDTLYTRWGLRLIDVRVSFIEKSDVIGFMEKVDTPHGAGHIKCPMQDLVVASDQFLQVVRSFLEQPKVLEMQQEVFQDTPNETAAEKEQKEPDRKVLETLEEYAKTPVLVFEEVNRSGKAIRQMLTPLLNQKELLGMTMYEAKIVATANKAIMDDPNKTRTLEEMQYYDAEGFKDFAYKSRFLFIDVVTTNPSDPRNIVDDSFRDSFIHFAAGPPYPYQLVVIKDRDEKTGEWKGTESLGVVLGPDGEVESMGTEDEQLDAARVIVSIVGPLNDPKTRAVFDDPRAIIRYHDATDATSVLRKDLEVYNLRTGKRKPIQREFNFCDEVLEFLSEADKDGNFANQRHWYNMDKVQELCNKFNSPSAPLDLDEKIIRSTPVTSFRTWEYLTKLIRDAKKRGKKELLGPALEGMMDPSTYADLKAFLGKKKWKIVSSTNAMSDVLDVCMDTGIPMLMQAGASAGKTTRVLEKVERMDMEPGSKGVAFFKMDMSSQTRLDIKGRPTPVDMVDSIFPRWVRMSKSRLFNRFKSHYEGTLFDVGDFVTYKHYKHEFKGNMFKVLAFRDNGETEVQEHKEERDKDGKPKTIPVAEPILVPTAKLFVRRTLPMKTTTFLPDESLQSRVLDAVAKGKKLVIFADEVNRVTDPVVMTSLFEAASDRRFMGVEFPPDLEVSIVSACNLGSLYVDAKSLDPAFVARCIVVNKPTSDKSDYDSCISWMKLKASQGKFHSALVKACEDIGYEMFAKMFFPDEAAKNTPTTSALQTIMAENEDLQCSATRYLEQLSNRLLGNSVGSPVRGRKFCLNKDYLKTKLHDSNSSEEFFRGWLGNGFEKTITRVPSDKSLEPLQYTVQDILDTVDDYFKRRDAKQLTKEEAQNIESGIFEFMAGVEIACNRYRERAIKKHLAGADPQLIEHFTTKFLDAADASIDFSDLRDSTLVYLFLVEKHSGQTTTLGYESVFFGYLTQAVSLFKYTNTRDYANWFIAFARFLSDVKSAAAFSEIVKLCYNNAELRKVLESFDYKEAKDLAEGPIRAKITGVA